jgi:hypothetical protein
LLFSSCFLSFHCGWNVKKCKKLTFYIVVVASCESDAQKRNVKWDRGEAQRWIIIAHQNK